MSCICLLTNIQSSGSGSGQTVHCNTTIQYERTFSSVIRYCWNFGRLFTKERFLIKTSWKGIEWHYDTFNNLDYHILLHRHNAENEKISTFKSANFQPFIFNLEPRPYVLWCYSSLGLFEMLFKDDWPIKNQILQIMSNNNLFQIPLPLPCSLHSPPHNKQSISLLDKKLFVEKHLDRLQLVSPDWKLSAAQSPEQCTALFTWLHWWSSGL